MKIITLTLNPAFDIHCEADGFVPYGESFVKFMGRDAAGKGINVSRALKNSGIESRAVAIVGEGNGEEFCRMLEGDRLTVYPIFSAGRIRENITLHERNKPETRISFGGFSVSKSILGSLKEAIGVVGSDTVITLMGSLPEGISSADALDMLSEFHAQGANIVIDSRSVSLSKLIKFAPWLIKPNRDEAEKYMNQRINSPSDAVVFAQKLHNSGIKNVMISLGGEGAVLVSDEGKFYANAPSIEAKSTVGAGDSTIAGFISAFAKGADSKACLATAVAFGSAACMREGTAPPDPRDIETLMGEISVTKL